MQARSSFVVQEHLLSCQVRRETAGCVVTRGSEHVHRPAPIFCYFFLCLFVCSCAFLLPNREGAKGKKAVVTCFERRELGGGRIEEKEAKEKGGENVILREGSGATSGSFTVVCDSPTPLSCFALSCCSSSPPLASCFLLTDASRFPVRRYVHIEEC